MWVSGSWPGGGEVRTGPRGEVGGAGGFGAASGEVGGGQCTHRQGGGCSPGRHPCPRGSRPQKRILTARRPESEVGASGFWREPWVFWALCVTPACLPLPGRCPRVCLPKDTGMLGQVPPCSGRRCPNDICKSPVSGQGRVPGTGGEGWDVPFWGTQGNPAWTRQAWVRVRDLSPLLREPRTQLSAERGPRVAAGLLPADHDPQGGDHACRPAPPAPAPQEPPQALNLRRPGPGGGHREAALRTQVGVEEGCVGVQLQPRWELEGGRELAGGPGRRTRWEPASMARGGGEKALGSQGKGGVAGGVGTAGLQGGGRCQHTGPPGGGQVGWAGKVLDREGGWRARPWRGGGASPGCCSGPPRGARGLGLAPDGPSPRSAGGRHSGSPASQLCTASPAP